jgi:hypothetical protein
MEYKILKDYLDAAWNVLHAKSKMTTGELEEFVIEAEAFRQRRKQGGYDYIPVNLSMALAQAKQELDGRGSNSMGVL